MAISFDLFLIDSSSTKSVIALGRRGADTVIQNVAVDGTLAELAAFGQVLGQSAAGNAPRPSAAELEKFGCRLFDFLFQGDLRQLYDRLPQGEVSLQILSDCPKIREIPWEYLVTPNCQPAPHRERSVIRVQPTCGVYSPAPRKVNQIRVLFVSADPVDQAGIDWVTVQRVLERALSAQMPGDVTVKVVEGATRAALLSAVNKESFDIFHFFGHGAIRNDIGHLVLQGIPTKRSDYLPARELAIALAGKGVKIAILSACLTGAGTYDDDFGMIATALIRAGVPAVLANQYPIPIKSIAPFVGAVYSSLLEGGNIDKAVADGRAVLGVCLDAATGDSAVIEWGIPTLYRLADSQQIFLPKP